MWLHDDVWRFDRQGKSNFPAPREQDALCIDHFTGACKLYSHREGQSHDLVSVRTVRVVVSRQSLTQCIGDHYSCQVQTLSIGAPDDFGKAGQRDSKASIESIE